MTDEDPILAILAADGRASARTIAAALGVSVPTASARLRALEADASVRVVLKRYVLHEQPCGLLVRIEAFVDDPAALPAVAAGFAAWPRLVSAYQTSGRPEIVALGSIPHIGAARACLEELAKSVPGATQMAVSVLFEARHVRPWLHTLAMPDAVARDDTDPVRAALRRNARQPASELARALGLPEPTIRQRVRRLIAAPGHRLVAMRDARAVGYSIWADLRLTLAPAEVNAAIVRIEALPDVVLVSQLSGEANVGVFVAARSVEALDQFVSAGIRTLPGLRTFQLLRVSKVIATDYSLDLSAAT
jgi:DNA-binding Lrp family transcriptional regulator